jgi:hypothetical protein
MSELNKYKGLPDVLLPQIENQCKRRIEALEKVISLQTEALEESLKAIYLQLDEAKQYLEDIESQIGS